MGFRPRSCQEGVYPLLRRRGYAKAPGGKWRGKSTRPPRAAIIIANPTPRRPSTPTRGAATLVEGLICTDATERPGEVDDGETR
jgi:hypothetical protein